MGLRYIYIYRYYTLGAIWIPRVSCWFRCLGAQDFGFSSRRSWRSHAGHCLALWGHEDPGDGDPRIHRSPPHETMVVSGRALPWRKPNTVIPLDPSLKPYLESSRILIKTKRLSKEITEQSACCIVVWPLIQLRLDLLQPRRLAGSIMALFVCTSTLIYDFR